MFVVLGVLALGGAPDRARAEGDANARSESTAPAAAPDDDADQRGYETASVGEDYYFSEAHRRKLYREGRLSYGRAALLTALLPGLGNFYARQYFLGGLNMSTVGFSAVIIPYGLVTDQPGFLWVGAGLIGAGYISGFATSYRGVRKFNRQLRRELRLSRAESPSPGRSETPWRIPPARTMLRLEFRFR